MNFEVFVLGTSGMMPLPNRFLTSAMVRRDGELFLFDCGEGTQVSLKMLNLKWKKNPFHLYKPYACRPCNRTSRYTHAFQPG